MELKIPPETSFTLVRTVDASHTASAAGSGEVDVLATPVLAAWMEQAALQSVAAYLPRGWTTVGTRIDLDHLKPTLTGEQVTVTARLTAMDRRALSFSITAADTRGECGRCIHQRFAVDAEKFIARARK